MLSLKSQSEIFQLKEVAISCISLRVFGEKSDPYLEKVGMLRKEKTSL